MKAGDIAAVILALVAMLTAIWAVVRFLFAPHIETAIGSAIDKKVGPRLAELPTLTTAVDRLTTAIERQSTDTERLMTTQEEITLEVHGLSTNVADLTTRTAVLEERSLPKSPRKRRASQ
jgi:hypothetical protein